jgi:hypothetical protein
LGALAITAFTAVQASAVTIDFTSNTWNPGNNNDTKTVGNTTVTANPSNADLTWDNDYGFGVQTHNDASDQIEEDEWLGVAFSTPFQLTSFSLTRLFDNEDGYYKVNGGSWIQFSGAGSGNKTVSLGSAVWVTSLQFGFPTSYNGNDAFFVESLTGNFQTTPPPPTVPEPTSMVLLGTGLVGLVARARRKRA